MYTTLAFLNSYYVQRYFTYLNTSSDNILIKYLLCIKHYAKGIVQKLLIHAINLWGSYYNSYETDEETESMRLNELFINAYICERQNQILIQNYINNKSHTT